MEQYDVVVIGGGPAGLASALAARKHGVERILIIERDAYLGGILNQCIHNGFGLHKFKEELCGTEYAQRYIEMIEEAKIDYLLNTMVLDISKDKVITYSSEKEGLTKIQATSVVLNMGCRENTRGGISIPGSRPSGVFSAGTAQYYMNIKGYLVGKRVVILGSGDIGLIMARRMKLEGAEVLACVEIMPYSNGLQRNIVQCLEDYDIPLYLSHTVTDIVGKERLEKVVISKVDDNRNIIKGSEFEIDCDCLLLSVGLIPENELSKNLGVKIDPKTRGPFVYENRETSIPGIFASGNVLHVHDIVDFVSEESELAGKGAADYCKKHFLDEQSVINVEAGNDISYAVPQSIRIHNVEKTVSLYFRVKRELFNARIIISCKDKVIREIKKEHLLPAEMEKVMLTHDALAQLEGNTICIYVLEDSL